MAWDAASLLGQLAAGAALVLIKPLLQFFKCTQCVAFNGLLLLRVKRQFRGVFEFKRLANLHFGWMQQHWGTQCSIHFTHQGSTEPLKQVVSG